MLVVDDFAQNLILPILPYYHVELKLSPFEIGVILASESIVVLVLSPLFGRWIRKIKRLSFLISVCMIAFALAICLYGYAASFTWILIGRVIQGIVVAFTFPAVFLLISRIFPGTQRVRKLSQINTWTMLAGLVAPFFSGTLIQFLGTKTAFTVVALGIIFVSGCFIAVIKNPNERSYENTALERAASSSRATGVLATVVTMAILGFFQFYMPLQLSSELHFNSFDIGLYLFILGIVFAAPQLFLTSIIEKTHHLRYLMFGLLLAGMILIASIHTIGWVLIVATSVTTMLLSAAFATSLVIMGSNSSASESFGLFEAGISAGLIVGTFGGGFVYDRFGQPSMALYGGLAVLASITLLLVKAFQTTRKGRDQHERSPEKRVL